MSAPMSIRASFAGGQVLPKFTNWKPDGNTKASISGESTQLTEPPYFAIKSETKWAEIGEEALGQVPRNSEIDKEGLAFIEHPAGHGNEGDIVRTAGVYLIHPILQTLWENPYLKGKIMCQSEASSNGIRADLTFYRSPTALGSTARPVAVVEFKKRGVIDAPPKTPAKPNDPRHVMLEDGIKKITATHDHGYWADKGQDEPGRSFFYGNSEVLMKQASSYAVNHGTQFVALFNWDYLVLVHFTEMDPSVKDLDKRRTNGVGEWCEMKIVPYKDSDQMRRALLGFLALAYQNTPP